MKAEILADHANVAEKQYSAGSARNPSGGLAPAPPPVAVTRPADQSKMVEAKPTPAT